MNEARIDNALIRTPVAWPLRIMLAVIVFISGLGLLSAWALSLSAAQLDRGLRGQMTLELPPDDNGKIDAAQTAEISRALDDLPGIKSVHALTAEETAALLRPWLGQSGDAKSLAMLPLPQLIDIQLTDPAMASSVNTMIGKKFPGAILSDHQLWTQKLAQQAKLAALALLVLVTILLLALFSTVAFACRAGLNVQLPTVALLHTIGATDAHICGQMRRYAWRLVWPGCVLGVLGCAMASAALIHLLVTFAPGKYAPAEDVFWAGAGALSLGLPLLAWGFARVSANLATLRVLRAMP